MKKSYEKDKNDLLEKINYLEKQNKLMIQDMKKEKYPDLGVVAVFPRLGGCKTLSQCRIH